jgi:hypothetical protein
MATKNTNGTYKVTVLDLHEVEQLVVDEQYYADDLYKKLLEADPGDRLPAITAIIEQVKYFALNYRLRKYEVDDGKDAEGEYITDGFSWMDKDDEKNTKEQLLMAAGKIRSTKYLPRALPFGSLKIKRQDREEDKPQAKRQYRSSSSSYASSSDGGKSKRTRRAKSKKRRTIKRRNALKR